MAKIQEPDATILNRLYASAQGKTAATDKGHSDVAFKDHEEFLGVLDEVLSSDDKQSWDPNDLILD
jgi:hypothetical protein